MNLSKEEQSQLRLENQKKLFEKIGGDLRVGAYSISISEEVSETDDEDIFVYTHTVRVS